MTTDKKPKLTIDLRGADGNVYAVIGKVAVALERAGQRGKVSELKKRAFEQRSYDAVLELCREYADVTYKR